MSDETSAGGLNSRAYWEDRFNNDWESLGGPAQSRFFARLAIDHLPQWFLKRAIEDRLTLADWGCALGDGTSVWAEALGLERVVGVDFASTAIEKARARFPAVTFLLQDWLTSEGVGAETYDIVFCSNILEHFASPYEALAPALKRARRALVLVFPFRERERLPEHEYTFTADTVAATLSNEFRLAWSRVIDCRRQADSLWPGEQAVLLYADSGWLSTLGLSLADTRIDHEDQGAIEETLRQELALKTAEIDRLEALANGRGEQLKVLEKRFAQREDALAALEGELHTVFSTRAWKAAMIYWRGRDSIKARLRDMGWLAYSFARSAYHLLVPHLARTRFRRLRHPEEAGTPVVPVISGTQGDGSTAGTSVIFLGGKLDILCLSIIDWDFRFQRPQQLLSQFARNGHRVFYVSPRFRTVDSGTATLRNVGQGVYELGLPGNPELVIYRDEMTEEIRQRAFDSLDSFFSVQAVRSAVVIVHHPFWAPLALLLKRRYGWKVVYDLIDQHTGFANSGASLQRQEAGLLQGSDLVVASSRPLYERARAAAPRSILLRNAADYGHFAALPRRSESPISRLPRPVIGYYGAIAEWFDLSSVLEAASNRPDWTFVLIGRVSAPGIERARALRNVHILGEVPYALLPQYVTTFDVCLIPFVDSELTRATNPVKLYEYFATGKPIVARQLPEIQGFRNLVYGYDRDRDLVGAIELALAEGDHRLRDVRLAAAQDNTWEQRYVELAGELRRLYGRASIIMVTFNNPEYTRLAISSVLTRTAWPNFELIVVDNGSGPEVRKILEDAQAAHPNVKVIFNDSNLGFARANKIGLREAGEAQYIALINDDVVVTSGWLAALIGHLTNEKIGLIGPVTNFTGNEACVPVDYRDVKDVEEFALRTAIANRGRNFDIRVLAMYCVAMRRDVLDKVGPLDEQFGIGMFEDDDYAHRVRQAGYRVVCAEDVFVHHFGSASFSKMADPEYRALFEKNRRLFEEKWKTPWHPHQNRGRTNALPRSSPSAKPSRSTVVTADVYSPEGGKVVDGPVFVIGSPRSGTSVLAWALAQHPDFWTSSESDYLYALMRDGRLREVYAAGTGYAGQVPRFFSQHLITYELFAECIGSGISRLYSTVSHGKRWIDSSPTYTLVAEELLVMFPAARFVHCLRDGRRVVCSMLRSGFPGSIATDFEEACRRWSHFALLGRRMAEMHPGKVVEVRHEHLLERPSDVCRELLDFLGASQAEAPSRFLQDNWVNSSYGSTRVDAPTTPWASWTPQQVATFRMIAGQTMALCGYGESAD